MSDSPEFPDLKFLPDWLKESEPASNRYANYEGEPERRSRDFRGPRPGGPRPGGFGGGPGGNRGPRPGGPRPGGPGGPRPSGPGGPPRGDQRGGPRPSGPGGPGGNRPDRGPRPGGPGGPRPGGDQRRDDRGPQGQGDRRGGDFRGGPRRDDRRNDYPPTEPAAVRVDFLPEPAAVTAIAKQIKSSHRAFPLFGTGRLFLERPERHRIRLTTLKEDAPLYQVGDGPISFDRAAMERDAFRQLKSKYYDEKVELGEAPKGIFTKVARLRGAGLILGPTNYHSYQPTLRRIYEERFSRRMSFADFQQYEIEIVSDEQTVNDWKEQARSVVTWTTTQEAEPQTFKSMAEVEAHFRRTYLPTEVRTGTTLEANGAVARACGDRSLNASIREATERERGFPVGIVNAMRPTLTDAGLHFFKHRKRVVYVSTIRPLHHPVGQPAKQNVLSILNTIEALPRCTRHDLAVKLLGEHPEAPEKSDEKTALAGDLHYLLFAGHVIEFADGKLDLPLSPKAQAAAAETAHDPAVDEETHAEARSTAPAVAAKSIPAAEVLVPTVMEEVPEATPAPVAEAAPEPVAEVESIPSPEQTDLPEATVYSAPDETVDVAPSLVAEEPITTEGIESESASLPEEHEKSPVDAPIA